MKMYRIFIIVYLFVPFLFFAKKHVVHNGESITSYIKISNCGDTIIVDKGIYYEYDINVDKSLFIIGISTPTIDVNKKGSGFVLISNDIVIENFQIQNIAFSYTKEYAAFFLNNVKQCTIKNNIILNSFFGIYLSKSDKCEIISNKIIGFAKKESNSGNAIHLWQCRCCKILNNTIEKHRDGIYLEFVKASIIHKNISKNNIRYGMHFMFSDSCEYAFNEFSYNTAGVAVMYSKNIKMYRNVFNKNWSYISNGILLKDIKESIIEYNDFKDNTIGIYMEGCINNQFRYNNVIKNGKAIKIYGNCDNNYFEKNNFIDNFFEVVSNSSINNNTFVNNFWTNYSGYDLNKDSIGDIPHHPVNLSTYILEISPNAVILLLSPLLDLLNLIEKVNPEFTPAYLIDEKPLMYPNKIIYDKYPKS